MENTKADSYVPLTKMKKLDPSLCDFDVRLLDIVEQFAWQGNVAYYCNKDGLNGLLSNENKVLCEPQWSWAFPFSDGLAGVVDQNGKAAFINMQGEYKASGLDTFDSFSEGYGRIVKDGLYGFVDRTGNVVIKPTWDEAGSFHGGVARVLKNDKMGIINTDGQVVVEPQWDKGNLGDCYNGLMPVGVDDKWGFVAADGKMAIELQWTAAGEFSDGLAYVQRNGLLGFINTSGEIVIEPQWEYCEKFSDGRALVRNAGKYGYINTDGEVVIDLQYSDANSFHYGLARVKDPKGSSYYYINTNGEMAFTGKWKDASDFSAEGTGIALVLKDNRIGVINTSGEYIVKPQSDEISIVSDCICQILPASHKLSKLGKLAALVLNTKGETISLILFL